MAILACFLSACNSKTPTTENGGDSSAISTARNKQMALNADQALINKDVEAMFKDCAPDFVDYGSGEHDPMKNQDTIKTGLKSFLAAFPDFKGENLQAVAQGDTVIVTGTWSGTFKNAYMGVKPTQKSFKIADADVFSFNKEGKITSHRSIQSEAALFSQLEIPTPAKK